MALNRKIRVALGVAVILTATATLSHANATSSMLQQYQSLCAQNVQCSAEMTERGLLFRLRMEGRTEKLLCQNDGACEALLPRSARYRVNDAAAWFTVK